MIGAVYNVGSLIVDLIVCIALFVALTIFFIRKKSILLLAIYGVATLIFVGVVVLDFYFVLPITKAISQIIAIFMVVAVIMVYQSDLKVMFFNLTKVREKNAEFETGASDEEMRKTVDEIITACQSMSKSRTGALIVIAPTSVANHILETGVELGATVSAALLEAIFNTRAPFHDGATVIKGNKVLAAGCFLPLSQSQTVSKSLGTRHRAGIGITEESDMLTIIVSEETGIISIAKRGELRRFITPDRLRDILHEALKISTPAKYRSIK
ncbi:MAG: diadenylate cyclase [Christensenellales bacterium]